MPSSEWPTPEAIEAVAARLDEAGWTHPQTGPPAVAVATDLLTIAAKACPVIPAPKNQTREWTLRVCPECDGSKVNDDGFTVCEGPSCGPFPTDAGHAPTVTAAVVVAEIEPLIWAREVAKSSADGWRAAFDHLAAHLDADDPDTAAVLDEAEARRSCHGTGVAEVIPVAVLREWATEQEDRLPPGTDRTDRAWGYSTALKRLTALLDEHTRKEPRP